MMFQVANIAVAQGAATQLLDRFYRGSLCY